VQAVAHVHFQRHAQLGSRRHVLPQSLLDLRQDVLADLEDQLVVHLHHEPRRQPLPGEPVVHADHRALDDVRRGALHRRVDRAALRVLAQALVA
jgi:hypothetical protein